MRNSISITIDNSCDEKPIKKRVKSIVHQKRNEVGIGLISVKNIVEKYDGITDFKYENGVFFASILLNTT